MKKNFSSLRAECGEKNFFSATVRMRWKKFLSATTTRGFQSNIIFFYIPWTSTQAGFLTMTIQTAADMCLIRQLRPQHEVHKIPAGGGNRLTGVSTGQGGGGCTSSFNFTFPRQAIAKILFVLDSKYTGDTPYRVWFDLDNSLTRWKRPIFKMIYLK